MAVNIYSWSTQKPWSKNQEHPPCVGSVQPGKEKFMLCFLGRTTRQSVVFWLCYSLALNIVHPKQSWPSPKKMPADPCQTTVCRRKFVDWPPDAQTARRCARLCFGLLTSSGQMLQLQCFFRFLQSSWNYDDTSCINLAPCRETQGCTGY